MGRPLCQCADVHGYGVSRSDTAVHRSVDRSSHVAGGAGACPSGQPRHGGPTQHLLDAAHGDGRPRADGEHSQRVPVRLDVPCLSFDLLRRRPVAAHAVVGTTRSTAAAGTSALPAGDHRLGVARSVTGSWQSVLDLGSALGVLWPIPPPQVAHYAAVLFGCTVILWFCGVIAGRGMAVTLVAAGAALVATHTRTALLGAVLGLVVAGASLFVGYARVRRTTAVTVLASLAAWIVFSPLIVSWLARGQSEQDLTQLTGRTKVWSAIAQQKFTTMQELFGTGLGNKSFNGLPIDSNWVATRLELGRLGVAIACSTGRPFFRCRHPAGGAAPGHRAVSHRLLRDGLLHRDGIGRRVAIPARARRGRLAPCQPAEVRSPTSDRRATGTRNLGIAA